MSLASLLALAVRRHAPVLVAPAKPTPRELKQLSDIDYQRGLRIQVPVLFLYRNNASMAGKDPAEVIREALAKALVPYYPFAGKLDEGANHKLFVDCTSEGVPFIEADIGANIEDVVGMIESGREPYFEELLHDVPGSGGILGCPLWLFQIVQVRTSVQHYTISQRRKSKIDKKQSYNDRGGRNMGNSGAEWSWKVFWFLSKTRERKLTSEIDRGGEEMVLHTTHATN